MSGIWERIKREPAVILTLLAALFGLAASFGLELSADRTAAITAVVTIVLGLVIRQSVIPVASVESYVAKHNDNPGV